MLRIACLLICLWLPSIAAAAERAALVIGNSAYAELSAPTLATSDAEAVANALRDLRYDVTLLRDAGRAEMIDAFLTFGQENSDADVALVYYAGHSAVLNGRTYLLPVDATSFQDDAIAGAVELQSVLAHFSHAPNGARLVMLDQYDSFGSERHGEFANLPAETAILSYIAPGDAEALSAADAQARRNSPLVWELMTQFWRMDVTIQQLGQSVSANLKRGAQVGHDVLFLSSITGEVYLSEGAAAAQTAQAPAPAPSPTGSDGDAAEIEFFDLAVQSGDPALLSAYLQRYPNGVFSAIAAMRLSELQANASATSGPVRPQPQAGGLTATRPRSRGVSVKPSNERGWVFTGKKDTPSFPWPPPQPSSTVLLPLDTIRDQASGQAIGDVMTFVESALNRQGYHDRSYWSVPGGAALATRLERINKNGEALAAPTRWPTSRLEADFSLASYLKSLFYTEPGLFRVIVFVLSTEAIVTADRNATSDEALDWLRRGMVSLPAEIAGQKIEPAHRLTALIYEFEKSEGAEAVVLAPGRLTGREHLRRAGLLATLAPN